MIGVTLLLMAIEDCITMKVNNLWQLLLLVEVLYTKHDSIELIVLSFGLFCIYVLTTKAKETKIGGADIKIFCILLLLGYLKLLYIVITASFLGIIYCLIRKQSKIPFVPFIWIGYTFVYF